MNKPAGGALHQTDRIHSHQLTIIQMKQNNKKSLSTFICPFAGALASITVTVLWVTIHTSGRITQMICVVSCCRLRSVFQTGPCCDWQLITFSQTQTITFRNLLPVPCVSQSYCNMLYRSIAAWFLLVVGQCLFHTRAFTVSAGRSDPWITSSLQSFKSCSDRHVIFSRLTGSCSASCLCASIWIWVLRNIWKSVLYI